MNWWKERKPASMVQPYGKIKTSSPAQELSRKSRESEMQQNLSLARQDTDILNAITGFATLKAMRATLDETTPEAIQAKVEDPDIAAAIAKTGFGQSLNNLKSKQT